MKGTKTIVFPAMAVGLLLSLMLLAAAPAAAGPPPAGKTYFVASIGLATDNSEAYEISAGCLRFTEDAVCDMSSDCGEWEVTSWGEPGPQQGGGTFFFTIVDDETGALIEIEGEARIEARGRRSTIAGAAYAIEPTTGTRINFGFVGRQVPRAQCLDLVEEFESE